MAQSLEQRLSSVDRHGESSITQQLVDAFVEAIGSGELPAGAKLPPIRELAHIARVNQLTAGRCYRRLQEQGLVVAGVGRGTFVRGAAGAALGDKADFSWQTYALPAQRDDDAGSLLAESIRHTRSDGLIALSMGSPASALIPLAELTSAVTAVLAAGGASNYEYGPTEGMRDLRAQLAALGRARGLHDEPDEILVTTGARQALTLATRAVMRPGDVAACESPSFGGMIEALRATGANVMPIPVDAEGFNVEALEQLLRAHEVRLVALQPRLQNPTGSDLTEERRTRLLELAERHGFFVLEDAVWGDLRFEGSDPGPLRALDPTHVIYVDSLSKIVAPGLRAGWVAASGQVLERIIAEKRDDDAHSPTLTQQVAARFLGDGCYPAQLARARDTYRERRDVLLGALDSDLAGLATFQRPAGGASVWVTLQQPRDDEHLYRAALASGVSYLPGPAMLVGRPQATHMRLSFGAVDPELLREGVRRIAATVRAEPHVQPRRDTFPVN